MAIKFRSKPTDPASPAASVAARFATPIETDKPVNPDAADKQQFSPAPAADKPAKKMRMPRSR